jgi:catechol 2,3-dioxygenase-like lactoylglutathione lyase family enzyme
MTNQFTLAQRVLLKVAIISLAALAAASIRVVFHVQRDSTTGIAFLAAAVGLYLIFERVLPSVYAQSDRRAPKTLTKKVFTFADAVAVKVHDVAAAQRWYAEKLGLHYSSTKSAEATMVLGYSADDAQLYFTKISGSQRPDIIPSRPPIIFARNLAAAHEYLSPRGVAVEPLRSDSGGNKFFRFRDLEGNELEVCQET